METIKAKDQIISDLIKLAQDLDTEASSIERSSDNFEDVEKIIENINEIGEKQAK